MKKSTFQLIMTSVKRTAKTAALLACCALMLYPSTVQALTFNALDSVNATTAWYDPDFQTCGSGASVTGQAANLLAQQKGLDQRWVNIIVTSANAANVDALAMASLLFWENRKWPAYGTIDNGSNAIGRGPWQITADTWPASAGSYQTNAVKPETSTPVAAQVVKSKGGTKGLKLGSIDQDFGKGKNLQTMATVAKNYNAGQATWRNPAVAGFMGNRTWMEGNRGAWFADKQVIIDDYIVGMTYVYWQIATGKQVSFGGNDAYIREALTHQEEMRNFAFKEIGSVPGATIDASTLSGCDSGNAAVMGDVVQAALGYAWNTSGHGKAESDAKPAYRTAILDKSNDGYSDCGVFVSTVMHKSGADPKYPVRGVGIQLAYVRKETAKYEIIEGPSSISQLKPGDILLVDNNVIGDGFGHTYIFVDTQKGPQGNYNSVAASFHDHVPEADQAYLTQSGYKYTVARLKK